MRFAVILIGVAAITLSFSGRIPAADLIIDDFESGAGLNKLGYPWYFYDDFKDGGNSTIPGVTKDVIGNYVVAPTAAAGHAGLGIALPYSLGPTKAGTGAGYNYIGMGTMLCGSGKTIDLTGKTACSFWLKCDKAISIDFQLVDTVNVKDEGYYHTLCPIGATNTWMQFTISLSSGIGGVAQPLWAKVVPFSLKTISKLRWQIHSDNVGTYTSGTINIDDIIIVDGSFDVPDNCTVCVATPGNGNGALLSNFETAPYNLNARGYYWYCFTDKQSRNPLTSAPSDASVITSGSTAEESAIIIIGPTRPYGFNGTNGAAITFSLGKKFAKTGSTDQTKPFVGIGAELCSEPTQSDFYNALADSMTGMYFDYTFNASDATAMMRLEVQTNQSLGANGAAFYILLPQTGKEIWKGAAVPFTKLVLPDWQGIVAGTPLDLTKLKNIHWTVQAGEGVTGEIAIDNVYLTPGARITKSGSTPTFFSTRVKTIDGITTLFANNNLKIFFSKGLTSGSISLINTQGSLVAQCVAPKNMVTNVNVAGLAKGVYMLKVKAEGSNGAYGKTAPITIY